MFGKKANYRRNDDRVENAAFIAAEVAKDDIVASGPPVGGSPLLVTVERPPESVKVHDTVYSERVATKLVGLLNGGQLGFKVSYDSAASFFATKEARAEATEAGRPSIMADSVVLVLNPRPIAIQQPPQLAEAV